MSPTSYQLLYPAIWSLFRIPHMVAPVKSFFFRAENIFPGGFPEGLFHRQGPARIAVQALPQECVGEKERRWGNNA